MLRFAVLADGAALSQPAVTGPAASPDLRDLAEQFRVLPQGGACGRQRSCREPAQTEVSNGEVLDGEASAGLAGALCLRRYRRSLIRPQSAPGQCDSRCPSDSAPPDVLGHCASLPRQSEAASPASACNCGGMLVRARTSVAPRRYALRYSAFADEKDETADHKSRAHDAQQEGSVISAGGLRPP